MLGGGRGSGGLLVNAEELVIQFPLRVDFVMRVVAVDLAFHLPGAGYVVSEIILPSWPFQRVGSQARLWPASGLRVQLGPWNPRAGCGPGLRYPRGG